jgi:hypothetical protein
LSFRKCLYCFDHFSFLLSQNFHLIISMTSCKFLISISKHNCRNLATSTSAFWYSKFFLFMLSVYLELIYFTGWDVMSCFSWS